MKENNGRVVGVSDGDTLTLLVEGKRQIEIRLADIDAPEGGKPYGNRAKQEISSLAFHKEAQVRVQGTDKHGRTVGRVFVGSVDVNAEPNPCGHDGWAAASCSGDAASRMPITCPVLKEKLPRA